MTRVKFRHPAPPNCGGVYSVIWSSDTHAVLARGTTGATARLDELEPASEAEYRADRDL